MKSQNLYFEIWDCSTGTRTVNSTDTTRLLLESYIISCNLVAHPEIFVIRWLKSSLDLDFEIQILWFHIRAKCNGSYLIGSQCFIKVSCSNICFSWELFWWSSYEGFLRKFSSLLELFHDFSLITVCKVETEVHIHRFRRPGFLVKGAFIKEWFP